ncbi:MAG TPA: hypothetical protein VG496_19820 [Myxococcales bacterium]|nr:hypothetical protein [Myxococcales bacterium]
MPDYARDTGYYLNGKLSVVALIAAGVRFPAGRWIRVASDMVPAPLVQELVVDLFPALGVQPARMVNLLTEFDVQEFERTTGSTRAGAPRPASDALAGAGGSRK